MEFPTSGGPGGPGLPSQSFVEHLRGPSAAEAGLCPLCCGRLVQIARDPSGRLVSILQLEARDSDHILLLLED